MAVYFLALVVLILPQNGWEINGEMDGAQTEMGGEGSKFTNGFKTNGEITNVTNPTSYERGKNNGVGKSGFIDQTSQADYWQNFPTKWRNESIKAGGNAICPQVAHQIFKAIQQYENLSKAI